MDKRIIAVTSILCCVSSFSYAAQDCEAVAGMTAGAADYLYETAQVQTTSQLHFASAPEAECQLPAFLVNGDKVEVLREARSAQSPNAPVHTFRYVRYRDTKGMFATGWVTAEDLTPLTNPLPVSPACQAWAHEEMPQREKMPPAADNHYQVTGNHRAWFYTMPDEQCRSRSVFLIPGDIVSAQEQSQDDFVEAVYYTADRHIVRGWLKKSQLRPLNSGDNYRNDINPLSTDKATQIATLSLRPDYQCIFYESWNTKNDIEIIVREDHQTEFCRGASDPETSPPVAYISINKASGEISWPDAAEGFEKE